MLEHEYKFRVALNHFAKVQGLEYYSSFVQVICGELHLLSDL